MTDTHALAVRDLSLAELARRIELNQKSGWGLEKATPAQLNGLALYCQKRGLLPGDEVTLYEGRPWITIDGHVTLMQRDHRGDYRGFSQRPLSRSEKEDWGYDPDDLVVETTVRSVSMGEIKAHGKVAKDERNGAQTQGRRLNPVARFNPVEMAQKRSLARAHRFAYGLDSYVDDEAFEREVQTVIEERNDPERVARNAAMYDRIYGDEEEGAGSGPKESTTTEGGAQHETNKEVANTASLTSDPEPAPADPIRDPVIVTLKTDPLWKAWLAAEREARSAGVELPTNDIHLGSITADALEASTRMVLEMVADAKAAVAQAEF